MEKWSRMKYLPSIPLGEDGRRVTSCESHIAFSRKAATEGMVLLENNGLLPLEKGSRIAIFGKAQIDYVKVGGGSGNVYCKYVRNIYEGFKIKETENKIKIYHKVSEFYEEKVKKELSTTRQENLTGNIIAATISPGNIMEPEIPDKIVAESAKNADVAIITICRYSGENWDRSSDKGDFYLNENEEKMIEKLCRYFDKIVVVLNVGGIVDTQWFKGNSKIGGALLAWNAGMEGGLAVADIIVGDVNPSGKLTDTFAKNFEDYPSSANYHESDSYVKYYEDIYVGYRYFETIPSAYKCVNYPFGYGLSYTNFEILSPKVYVNGENICVETVVTNTGKMSGREVVQVYYSAPQGKLGKSSRVLAAFKKTRLLAPGETEKISLAFKIDDMASYDDVGKCAKSAYVLEKGEYAFYIGNSVRNTQKADFVYVVIEDFRVTKQLTERMPSYDLEKRMLADGTYEEMPKNIKKSAEIIFAEPLKPNSTEKIWFDEVAEGKATLDDFVAQLDIPYLVSLLGGKPAVGIAPPGGVGGTIRNWGTYRGCDDYGVPCAMTTDGPAGIKVTPGSGVVTTCFPCATLLACTWDEDVLYEMGRIGALEAKENNLMIWLTPGMNIHRSPLCGRNFEYFSEDPLVSGKMAAAEVRGIQSQNIVATPKHFACNNKETNRFKSDSIVSERALREIYLKGFEICVKEASPKLLMSSYNFINSIRASENYDMLTGILREEWGYKGAVTTDWGNQAHQINELAAGNDLRMPDGNLTELKELLFGWKVHGRIGNVQQSAKRILQLLLELD
ncbi:MAG: glycoside hydrolase family 3 protein [Clostridia bacterium]|nr:glycoside hydrolase family 3 protein [Clostridia bacterium]